MWPFEVKLLVNRANIRECYLQAVSNSSWANRGYLFAAKVSSDEITRYGLTILAETHGIGVIEQGVQTPLRPSKGALGSIGVSCVVDRSITPSAPYLASSGIGSARSQFSCSQCLANRGFCAVPELPPIGSMAHRNRPLTGVFAWVGLPPRAT